MRTSTGGYAIHGSVTCVSSSTLEYGAGRSRCMPWRRMYACFALLFEDHRFIPDALLILGCTDELRQARRQLLVFSAQFPASPSPTTERSQKPRNKESCERRIPADFADSSDFLFEISSIIALACCYP